MLGSGGNRYAHWRRKLSVLKPQSLVANGANYRGLVQMQKRNCIQTMFNVPNQKSMHRPYCRFGKKLYLT